MAGIALTLLLAGLLTYATRLSFIALIGHWQPPVWFLRGLRFVPPAVLSAIILPDMLVRDGHAFLSPANPRLWAGLLAMLIAWRTRNTLLTILAGMLVLAVSGWLVALSH